MVPFLERLSEDLGIQRCSGMCKDAQAGNLEEPLHELPACPGKQGKNMFVPRFDRVCPLVTQKERSYRRGHWVRAVTAGSQRRLLHWFSLTIRITNTSGFWFQFSFQFLEEQHRESKQGSITFFSDDGSAFEKLAFLNCLIWQMNSGPSAGNLMTPFRNNFKSDAGVGQCPAQSHVCIRWICSNGRLVLCMWESQRDEGAFLIQMGWLELPLCCEICVHGWAVGYWKSPWPWVQILKPWLDVGPWGIHLTSLTLYFLIQKWMC